ncbi:MAG: cell wall biosynthesis glycosyltransferase [Rhodospirillaceae bacterium]|nr:MAG: cell wall biosynthesis glycosyltransferase [Rhodospirillaceae bacterium]
MEHIVAFSVVQGWIPVPVIGAVIPCYRVARHVAEVIASVPSCVHHIICVDDACPQDSGTVAEKTGDARVVVVRHVCNRGVGGAMVTGYRKALELGCHVVVKVDGDGQMDPAQIGHFLAPLLDGTADYAKGNRFADFQALKAMPKVRLVGNSLLSFLVKAASGYWTTMDPTNGYTAIHRRVLEQLDLDQVAPGYFFESDLLIRLNILNAVVTSIPIPAFYGTEESSLRLSKVLLDFPPRLVKGFLWRILLKYFVYDFNMGSVYISVGLPLALFGLVFGSWEWLESVHTCWRFCR